jgi:hypothetical protein
MAGQYKTTEKDFELFKLEFKKWQKFLSAENYGVDFHN